jgi:hypothetical protein
VFHSSDAFHRLEHAARGALAVAGLSKGPRRALAHIGVEFLIDDELGNASSHGEAAELRSVVVSRYAAALRFGASAGSRRMLHWSNPCDADHFAQLCRRLAAHAEPAQPPSRHDADRRLAVRLVACLAGRPRLELRPDESAALEPWLAECRPAVAAATPSLLSELARGLHAPPRHRPLSVFGLAAAE